ncbi:MAG TPA: Ig-like domain-containing protein [Candidatus Dormibacteraeota bacterium]|nr:Ig-like domain-containing protein [Candidatus Dormibacteraeota bacterium]
MNSYHDPELDDVLQDDELRHIASMLRSSTVAEPPLDEAFRTGLRRQLMNEAWTMTEGRGSWWRRAFAPPGLAWAGATAGLLLIAAVVVYTTLQQPGGLSQTVQVASPLDGNRSVALQQPILVSFNQPMDRPSTESAVQISPATNVTYSWADNSRTLAVQPTGGTLAPNTQYQVTIGQGAKTAAGTKLSTPQTITFVTTPPTSPSATPTPRPTPTSPVGEKLLTSLGGATTLVGQWSSDSSSVYYLDGKGALKVVTLKGGTPDVIATDSASSPSISLTGGRLAYIRDGKIEVLTFASGKTDELNVTPTPVFVGWGKDKLIWAAAGGLYTQAGDGSAQQVAPLPDGAAVTVVAIAPDGAHAAYTHGQNLFVLDLATGKSVQLGQAGAVFQDWSPGGSELLYATADNVIVADTQGNTLATLPAGDASWSSQDAILIGGDTDVLQVRPDGSNASRLSGGTYRSVMWAPNGTTFVFVRGGNIWTGTAPALPPEPTPLDDATAVVNNFMQARVAGQADQASALLDATGKTAYSTGGLKLTVTGDPRLSRSYILTSEITGTQPDTARFVVRLVLTHGKLDVSTYEETLTLVRDATSHQFLIDQATAGATHDLGKGAQVVNVDVESDTVKVTFDSDLDPATVTDGVTIVDSKGKQLDATASYANRVVTLTGLNLKPGEDYRLVVLTSLRDVQGQSVAAEYDLELVGPSPKKHATHRDVVTPSPSPSPSPPPAA